MLEPSPERSRIPQSVSPVAFDRMGSYVFCDSVRIRPRRAGYCGAEHAELATKAKSTAAAARIPKPGMPAFLFTFLFAVADRLGKRANIIYSRERSIE